MLNTLIAIGIGAVVGLAGAVGGVAAYENSQAGQPVPQSQLYDYAAH